ncbi:MAG: glycosyltransferase family 39 protein, partial [Dichotomicrobium sp.]
MSGAGGIAAQPARALDVETIARYTVWIILAYFVAQLAIRLGLSGNLETDEAQFVGQTDFAFGYGNSHPPVYNWLVGGALYLTGSWPAAVALIKNAFLAGTYLLVYDTGRRISGRHLTGLLAAASLLFLPQVVWKSQITLAHSVMVMFGVAATLHAAMLIRERGRTGDFLWLGVAACAGAFAKYNYFIALAAILLAAWSVRELRDRLFVPRLAWSAGLFALLYMPHLVWVAANLSEATQRVAKLERMHPLFSLVDLPVLGIDGLLAMGVAALAWAGPLVTVWFLVWRLTPADGPRAGPDAGREIAARFFARVTLFGLGILGAAVLAADFHDVHERYLTPLLISVPLWLAAAWPLELRGRAPVHFLRVAGVLVLAMLTAWPGWILFGKEQFAYPYRAFAADIRAETRVPIAVLAERDKIGANIAIRLDGARMWSPGEEPGRVLLVWEGHSDGAPGGMADELGEAYAPAGAVVKLTAPYDNFSGETARLSYQVFQ